MTLAKLIIFFHLIKEINNIILTKHCLLTLSFNCCHINYILIAWFGVKYGMTVKELHINFMISLNDKVLFLGQISETEF